MSGTSDNISPNPKPDFPIGPRKIRVLQDYFYDLFGATYERRVRRTCVTICAGLIAYFVGLSIALAGGFAAVYVSTPAVYILTALFSYGVGRIRWLSLMSIRQLNQIRPAFLVSDQEYVHKIVRLARIVYSVRMVVATCGASCLVGWALLGVAFLHPTSRVGSIVEHLLPPTFPSPWFHGAHATWKLFVLDWFVLLASVNLAQLGYGGLTAIVVLPHATDDWHVVPIPAYLVAQFRSLANYFLVGATVPAVGVFGMVLLYEGRTDPVMLATVAVLVMFGLLIVFMPQYAIRRVIYRARAQVADAVHDEYLQSIASFPTSSDAVNSPVGESTMPVALGEFLRFQEVMSAVNSANISLYRFDQVVTGIVSQAVPLLAFLYPYIFRTH